MKKTVDLVARSVTFTFDEGIAPQTIYLSDMALGLRDHAALHGVGQKVGDNAAGCKSESERSAAVAVMIEHLETAGDDGWNRKATGDGSGNAGLLVRALVQMSGKPIDEIKGIVGALDAKEQAAMRAQPTVAAVIATLRKPAKVDVGATIAAINVLAKLTGQTRDELVNP